MLDVFYYYVPHAMRHDPTMDIVIQNHHRRMRDTILIAEVTARQQEVQRDATEERQEALPSEAVTSPGAGLLAVPEDRIRLSDPDDIRVQDVAEQHTNSRRSLVVLRDKLDALHGDDVTTPDAACNTQQVPLSESDLQLLRSVVDAAIALHRAPTISRPLINALRNIYECLVDLKERLDNMTLTTLALAGLVAALSLAVDALQALLESLTAH